MSTSVANLNHRTVVRYLALTLFCCIFSSVYEVFSHHVISIWMISLPLFPLLLGVLPFLILRSSVSDGWPRQLWHCGVATGMTGSCLAGIFEIAGIHMPYTMSFLLIGGVLLILAIVLWTWPRNKTM